MSDSADESKTALFKLYYENPPQFTITYSNKEDLYESFKNRLEERKIPSGAAFWVDLDGDRVKIKDADTLLGIVTSGANTVRITICDENDDSDSFPEYEKAVEERRMKKRHRKQRNRICDHCHEQGCHPHSHGCDYSRARHSSDREDLREFCGHCQRSYCAPPFFATPSHHRPPMCCSCYPFYYPVDTQFRGYPFFGMGHGQTRCHCFGC